MRGLRGLTLSFHLSQSLLKSTSHHKTSTRLLWFGGIFPPPVIWSITSRVPDNRCTHFLRSFRSSLPRRLLFLTCFWVTAKPAASPATRTAHYTSVLYPLISRQLTSAHFTSTGIRSFHINPGCAHFKSILDALISRQLRCAHFTSTCDYLELVSSIYRYNQC